MVLFNLTITNCACKIFFIWRTHVRSTTHATPHFRTCEYAHLSLLMCCFYQQVAMYHTPRGWYFSTRAKIGIWGSPNQGRFQESGASILVTSNELEGLNALEAGFHVRKKKKEYKTWHPCIYANSMAIEGIIIFLIWFSLIM